LCTEPSNFWQILIFGGFCTDPRLPMRVTIWCAKTHGIRMRAKFRLDRFILSPSVGEKKTIFAVFSTRHLVVSPIDSNLRMLNMGAQLQTFPYPTASKPFLCANTFVAKSGAQSLTFKSVTDRQTNRQTDKKAQRFWPPRRRVK